MGKSDKNKKDKKKKDKNKDKKNKNLLVNSLKTPIDTSKLTNAEYEAMFVKKFDEERKKKTQKSKKPKKSVQFTSINNGADNSDIKQNNEQDEPEIIKKIYVRHCQSCNKFIKTDKTGDYSCPVCAKSMIYAIHCDSCNLWFDVKTPKKYPCPKCKKIISHISQK